MKSYYTGGTVGDTYITLCKLYPIARKEKILCRHHTIHKEVEQVVQEIYSLLPNIYVEFLKDELLKVQVHGVFGQPGAEQDKYNFKPEYYPEFDLESIECFGLPEAYMTLQAVSGFRQDRRLPARTIEKVVANAKLPVVLIGEAGEKVEGINDVRGLTSIKQIINIVRNSKYFHGPQGFLSFVAVSQKVPSTIYITSNGDDGAIQRRIEAVEEWRKFLVEKVWI